MAADHILAPRL